MGTCSEATTALSGPRGENEMGGPGPGYPDQVGVVAGAGSADPQIAGESEDVHVIEHRAADSTVLATAESLAVIQGQGGGEVAPTEPLVAALRAEGSVAPPIGFSIVDIPLFGYLEELKCDFLQSVLHNLRRSSETTLRQSSPGNFRLAGDG